MRTGFITFFSILVAGSSFAQTKDSLAEKL